MNTQDTEGAIERVTAWITPAENLSAALALKPPSMEDVAAILNHVSRLEEAARGLINGVHVHVGSDGLRRRTWTLGTTFPKAYDEAIQALSTLPRPEGNSSLPPKLEPDNAEYRKTATIRATQYLGQHVAGVCTGGQSCQSRGAPDEARPHIHGLEGDMSVSHGDWIATGVKGEHWAIKPDVFAASYAPVQQASKGGAEPSGDCETGYKTVPLALQEGDLATVIREEIVRQHRDNDRTKWPAGAADYDEYGSSYLIAKVVRAALSPQTAGAGDKVLWDTRVFHPDRLPVEAGNAARLLDEDDFISPLPVGEDLRERPDAAQFGGWEACLRTLCKDLMARNLPDTASMLDDMLARFRLCADAVALVSQDQWRPIETAPKDGTVILGLGVIAGEVSGRDALPSRAAISWMGGRTDYPGYDWDVDAARGYSAWMQPTLWMPLPAPPSSKLEG